MSDPKPVKACLFDMDGLLINTEDIYTETTNELLAEHGKGPLPWEVKINLQGRPGTDAAKHFLDWSKLPYTPEELFAKTTSIQEKKWPRTAFLPGALELLEKLKAAGVPIALATSSHTANYHRKTAHLRHGFDLFGKDTVTGDDKRIPPGRGKPQPDIWLVALTALNEDLNSQGKPSIKPEECLVFEDGVPGVAAGRAAGCQVVWVPDQRALDVLGEEKTKEIIGPNELLKTLVDFDPKKYGLDV